MRDKLTKEQLENFIETHKVVYIRHNLRSSIDAYKWITLAGIVAVHYTEKLKQGLDSDILDNHYDPENFDKPARGVLKRFNQYCIDGAVVFADYSDPEHTSEPVVNLGIIPEGDGYDVKRYPEGFTYKQKELLNYKTLNYSELAPFLAIHPRGGTISEFNAENAVKFVYGKAIGLPVKPSVDCLLPAQQEVLCSEYLRARADNAIRIKYLLMPVGRGMKAIDIDGINDNSRIFAQVSFSNNEKEINQKIQQLKTLCTLGKKISYVYFGPKEKEAFAAGIAEDVRYISLEDVFTEMSDTGLVNDMLEYSTLSNFDPDLLVKGKLLN